MEVQYLQVYPKHWNTYALIDSGNFEKLEQFGNYVLRRPEPQALWSPFLSEKEWNKKNIVLFEPTSSHSGNWIGIKTDNWLLKYQTQTYKLQFQLTFTKFKHIGIFPEQAENWDYIYEKVTKLKEGRVLNLFAYTGGATLAAAIANQQVQVTHLDAVKQVVNWAKQNAKINHLQNIRWIIDDALSFVKREIRRGNLYEGIIMDPPAFGHGPNGELWKLEEHLNNLIFLISKILNPKNFFFVINTYSLNFSPILLENLIKIHFKNFPIPKLQIGDLYLKALSNHKLPTGVFCRFSNL